MEGSDTPAQPGEQIDLEVDVYRQLRNGNMLGLWEAGKGPGHEQPARPNKFKQIGRGKLTIEYFGEEEGQG